MPTLQQIKLALKISHTTDDAELLRLREAVISLVENYTGLTLQTKSVTQYSNFWMRTRLNDFPFVSITSVQYYNSLNVLTTLPTADWFLDKSDPPATFINFLDYPSLYEGTQIVVNYVAGSSVIPLDLDQAIIAFVGGLYNNPEHLSPISLQEVPLSAKFILDNHKNKSVLS